MNQDEVMAWSSHMPAIMACLAVTDGDDGPVLELGVGHFSTPQLHAYCVSAGRDLISVESNTDWFNKFKSLDNDNTHKLYNISYQDVFPIFNWSVVFIDQSPGGEERSRAFSRYIGSSCFVIVHDYHRENEEAIAPLLDGCKFHVCTKYQPPTLVASKIALALPRGILDL